MANVTFTGNSFLNPYGMPTRNNKKSQLTDFTPEQISNALAIAHLTNTPDEEIDPGSVDDNPDASLTGQQTEQAVVTITSPSATTTPIEPTEPAVITITSPSTVIASPPTPVTQLDDMRALLLEQGRLMKQQQNTIILLSQERDQRFREQEESRKRTHDQVDQSPTTNARLPPAVPPATGFSNVRLPPAIVSKGCSVAECKRMRMQRPLETLCSACKYKQELKDLSERIGIKDEVDEIKALKKQKIVMEQKVKLACCKNGLKDEIAQQQAALNEFLATNQ